jgi:GNAT superfamily N-acetyltransferase
MVPDVDIRLLQNGEISSIIPLLLQLNPALESTVLSQHLREMVEQGYCCAGVFDADVLVGICGFRIITKYYVGKHIEPDNMVIHSAHRGKGLGKHLLAWVCAYGKTQGCVASELNCYVTNTQGQAFWVAQGYRPIALHYQQLWGDECAQQQG